MGSNPAKRTLVVYVTLLGLGLAVCGWQLQEHRRFQRTAADALINRGRDITSTLGVVMTSQRNRFGPFVNKDRLEATLGNLIRPNQLEAVAILSTSGEIVARAGAAIGQTPDEMLDVGGVFWGERLLTVMNPIDFAAGGDDGRSRSAIIVADESNRNSRQGSNRNTPSGEASGDPAKPAVTPPTTTNNRESRGPFGPRMSREEFDAAIKKQGVQSIVVSLSTTEMHRTVSADRLLRSLVSLLAMGGAVISALAWRNLARNADLQIRLIKAGEMNTHLKEMNLAAAGLAHETRNPLNLIRGLAQIIAMQAKEAPKLKEHAATIVEEADRVTVQLNEFINYSKPREVQMAPVNVQQLVADVSRTLLLDLEEKQIELKQPEAAILVEADEQLLRQALFNVLLNAVQALPAGGHIEVKVTPSGSRGAVLEIVDDGPGVPAAERAAIFKPYVTMRPKGVGLGLAIVAQIGAVHHWEVTCEANEPHGARFVFKGLKLAATPT